MRSKAVEKFAIRGRGEKKILRELVKCPSTKVSVRCGGGKKGNNQRGKNIPRQIVTGR